MGSRNQSAQPDDLELSPDRVLHFLKRNLPFLLLLAIIVWGYSLRAYHLDYPVVGYHNMKEAHTLGEALNFYRGESLSCPASITMASLTPQGARTETTCRSSPG